LLALGLALARLAVGVLGLGGLAAALGSLAPAPAWDGIAVLGVLAGELAVGVVPSGAPSPDGSSGPVSALAGSSRTRPRSGADSPAAGGWKMTGGGWNVACGTVADPAEAVDTAGTTGVAAADALAGAGPSGPPTGGALLASALLAGAVPGAGAVVSVLGGMGASSGGPAARVAARRGLRVRRAGAADSPPSPGSLPLAAALASPGLAVSVLLVPALAVPGLASPGPAVPVRPDGGAPPSLSLPRAVSF
jgi:hypothetical protein